MATTSITASCCSTSMVAARAAPVPTARMGSSSFPVLGLPVMAKKRQIRCSMKVNSSSSNQENVSSSTPSPAPLAAAMATALWSPAAMALVDERMSTEGTGLPFGLSNNLLGWILLGVFALIWSLYFAYTSTLEEDEESGLSL